MELISVISPIYKVGDYLERCVNSITSQTYRNLEIILVDDGSPDSCGEICDRLAGCDGRIKVIHKENGGAASARNAGMEIASGDYLFFPDADDWLEPTYIEELFHAAKKTGAQLVVSGYTMEYCEDGKYRSYAVSVPEKDFACKEQVRNNLHDYFDNMMMAVSWNKLYSADHIRKNKLAFPDVKWDDLHFNMKVIWDIEHVAISGSCGYHFFRSRPGSETAAVFDGKLYEKRREQFQHILRTYEHWEMKDREVMSVIYGYYASRLVQCIQETAISSVPDKKDRVRRILDDELTKKAFREGEIRSGLLRIAAIPMKNGSVGGSLAVGRLIGFVKDHMASVFYRLKSVSVNRASVVAASGNIR